MPVLDHEASIDLAVRQYARVYGLQNCEAELHARVSIAVTAALQKAKNASYVIAKGGAPEPEQIGRQKRRQ
jgi:hypothetical protein